MLEVYTTYLILDDRALMNSSIYFGIDIDMKHRVRSRKSYEDRISGMHVVWGIVKEFRPNTVGTPRTSTGNMPIQLTETNLPSPQNETSTS
jgi:hypothetical protein